MDLRKALNITNALVALLEEIPDGIDSTYDELVSDAINDLISAQRCLEGLIEYYKANKEDNIDNLATDQWGGAGPDCKAVQE